MQVPKFHVLQFSFTVLHWYMYEILNTLPKNNIRSSHMKIKKNYSEKCPKNITSQSSFLGKLYANNPQLYGSKTRSLWQPQFNILSSSYLKAITSNNYRMVSKLSALWNQASPEWRLIFQLIFHLFYIASSFITFYLCHINSNQLYKYMFW